MPMCVKAILLSLPLLLTACSPNGIGVGVYGGSHSGIGVGMSFPFPGSNGRPADQSDSGGLSLKQGQIVAQNEFYYRRFVGAASNGSFVVQDFYNQNKSDANGKSQDAKLSDIYSVTGQDNVLNSLPAKVFDLEKQDWDSHLGEWLVNLKADGVVTLWHINGQKAISLRYNKQQPEGEYLQWYGNGQLHWQGEYRQGKRSGVWRQWSSSGRLISEEKPNL